MDKETKANKFKEAGNKAFSENNFEEAITQYTLAIEISADNPNQHVYYANRANAYLHSGRLDECIEDCEEAIYIEPMFIKAYYR